MLAKILKEFLKENNDLEFDCMTGISTALSSLKVYDIAGKQYISKDDLDDIIDKLCEEQDVKDCIEALEEDDFIKWDDAIKEFDI